MYGILEEIRSDNGLPINGPEFSNFAQEQGFSHRKVTPAWAEANGDRERFLQMLKKSAKILDLKGKPFDRKFKKPLATIVLCPTK